jgi:hypothetical protein
MLFREINAVYCGNHAEHTNGLLGETAELFDIKEYGTYSDHFG